MRTTFQQNAEYLLGLNKLPGLVGIERAIANAIDAYPWPPAPIKLCDLMKGSPSVVVKIKPHAMFENLVECQHGYGSEPYLDNVCPQLVVRILDREDRDSLTFSAPLAPLFATARGYEDTYTVYRHEFVRNETVIGVYIGITRRGWTARWRQHLNEGRCGSPYLFHQAIRNRAPGDAEIHHVMACDLSYEDAMNFEELAVSKISDRRVRPEGLNMIPGGFAGIRYLGSRGFKNITARQWENRGGLLRKFSRHCDQIARSNPKLAAMWLEDTFAAARICGNPNNFNIDEVRRARSLSSMGLSSSQIADIMQCRLERVMRLLQGRTYLRVQ